MGIRSILTLILLLLAISNIGIAQNNTETEFEKALSSKSADINTITCKFAQTRSMSILADDAVKQGIFYYLRPDNILLSFEDGDYIKITETVFQMKNAGNVTKVNVSSNPMLKELKRILGACMTGNLAEMTSSFRSNITETDKSYLVVLSPSRGKSSAKIARIILEFDKSDMSLSLLKMEEPSGDYTKYVFTDKVINKQVDAQLFAIE